MRRFTSLFLALATLVPAVALLAAVSTTPSSANAFPVFEFTNDRGSVRVSASRLGVVRKDGRLQIDDETFDQALAMLQSKFKLPPVAGGYELKADHKVVLKPGVPGVELDPDGIRAMLIRALHGQRSNLRLPTRHVAPPKSAPHAIVVNLQKFRLDLYEGSALSTHFPVGVGALSFPTPPGAYYIRSKARNPTWRNPGSSWARGMPAYIAPGPRNPLGTRALRLDRGALVIHGTPQPWTIGRRSSHGCIRMRRPDVEKLFDLVGEQTPVFIVP